MPDCPLCRGPGPRLGDPCTDCGATWEVVKDDRGEPLRLLRVAGSVVATDERRPVLEQAPGEPGDPVARGSGFELELPGEQRVPVVLGKPRPLLLGPGEVEKGDAIELLAEKEIRFEQDAGGHRQAAREVDCLRPRVIAGGPEAAALLTQHVARRRHDQLDLSTPRMTLVELFRHYRGHVVALLPGAGACFLFFAWFQRVALLLVAAAVLIAIRPRFSVVVYRRDRRLSRRRPYIWSILAVAVWYVALASYLPFVGSESRHDPALQLVPVAAALLLQLLLTELLDLRTQRFAAGLLRPSAEVGRPGAWAGVVEDPRPTAVRGRPAAMGVTETWHKVDSGEGWDWAIQRRKFHAPGTFFLDTGDACIEVDPEQVSWGSGVYRREEDGSRRKVRSFLPLGAPALVAGVLERADEADAHQLRLQGHGGGPPLVYGVGHAEDPRASLRRVRRERLLDRALLSGLILIGGVLLWALLPAAAA